MFRTRNRWAGWLRPATLLLPLGATLAATGAELPRAQKLATPAVRTLLGYTRRVLHLKDGHTLAVFSYSGSAPANWLFLIDARDLSSQRFAIPNNDIASHSAAVGTDGNIYIMPYEMRRASCSGAAPIDGGRCTAPRQPNLRRASSRSTRRREKWPRLCSRLARRTS